MLTLLHASDLHFGKAFVAEAGEALVRAAFEIRPDVVVVSGDLTQRAKVREYQEAKAYLQRLPAVPVVVTPGNHDVPLYRILERAFHPYRNYRSYISRELDTVTRVPGATIVSLNSAAPHHAIVNGRISPEQIAFAEEGFAAAEEGELRVVVAHHHLAPAPDYEGDRPLPRARELLDAFGAMGVDLILGGHLHRSFIGHSLDVHPGADRDRGIVIVQSGTTTSGRGRARERARNSFNLVRICANLIQVVHCMYMEGGPDFVPVSVHAFPRRDRDGVAFDRSILRDASAGVAEWDGEAEVAAS